MAVSDFVNIPIAMDFAQALKDLLGFGDKSDKAADGFSRSWKSAGDTVGTVLDDLFDDLNDLASQPVKIDIDEAIAELKRFDTVAKEALQFSGVGDSFSKARKELAGVIDQQKAALAGLVAAGGKGSQQYEDLLANIRKNQQELGKLEDAAKDVAETLADPIQMEVDVEEAKSAMDGLVEQAKSILSSEALEKAGAFFDEFSQGGVEARDALQKMRAQTGLVGEELDALKDRADNAFKRGVGENLAEARTAIATAQQQMGKFLDGEGIEEVTVGAAGIAKVFDKDVSEVIGKSRTLIQNFGLEGEHGMQLMALAAQKGGTAMDDVLDTMDEYSQLAAQTGASAEEWTGLLVNGVQQGARDTDKIADSLKELQIRLKAGDTSTALAEIQTPITATIAGIVKAGEEGKKSTFQVAQETARAIEDAFQAGKITETMRSQLQVAIAGTPAEDLGSDLYGRIFSAEIDTQGINEQASKAAEDITSALGPTSIAEKIGRSFDLIKTKVSEATAPLTAGLGNLLGTVSQVGPGLNLIGTKLGGDKGFAGILEKITGKGGDGGGLLGSLKGGLMGSLGPAAPWLLGAAAAVTALVLLYNNSEKFRNAVDNLVKEVVAFATQLWEAVKPALDALLDVGMVIAEVVLELLIAQVEFMIDVWSTVITVVGDFIAGLFGLEDAGTLAKTVLGGVADAANWVKGALETLQAVIKGVGVFIKTFAGEAAAAVDALFSFDFAGAAEKMYNAFSVASTAAAEKVKQEQAANNGKVLSGIFSDVVEGVNSFKPPPVPIRNPGVSIPKRGTPASTKAAAKAVVLDFTEEVQRLTREATDITNALDVQAKTDSVQRYRDEWAEKLRIVERGIEDEKAALIKKAADTTKLKDSEKTDLALVFGALNDTDDAKLKEALEALSQKRLALLRQHGVDEKAAATAIAQERIDAETAASERAYQDQANRLTIALEGVTGNTLEAIQQRGEASLQLLDAQQKRELELLLNGLLAKSRLELEAEVLSGNRDRESADAELAFLRAGLLARNSEVKLLLDRQLRTRKEAETQFFTNLQDGLDKSREAYADYGDAINGLFDGMFDQIDEKRRDDLNKEIDDLLGDRTDLWGDFLQGKIKSYEDYADQIAAIDQKIADKQSQLTSEGLDYWDRLYAGTLSGLQSLGQTFSSKLAEDQAKLGESIKIKGDDVSVNLEELSDGMVQVGIDTSGVLLGTWAKMAESGKATLGDFADATLLTVIDVVRGIVRANIAAIVAAAFAINPFVGVGSIVAIGLVEGLLAAAESDIQARLGKHGFMDGGFTPNGPRDQAVGVVHAGEFVGNQVVTNANRAAFAWLHANQGRTVEDYIIAKHGAIVGLSAASSGSDKVATHADVQKAIEKQTVALGQKIDQQGAAIAAVAHQIAEGIPVTGSFEIDGATATALVKTEKRRSRSVGGDWE